MESERTATDSKNSNRQTHSIDSHGGDAHSARRRNRTSIMRLSASNEVCLTWAVHNPGGAISEPGATPSAPITGGVVKHARLR
jgi:hypothetical protein